MSVLSSGVDLRAYALSQRHQNRSAPTFVGYGAIQQLSAVQETRVLVLICLEHCVRSSLRSELTNLY